MDALSQILDSLELEGSLYFATDLRGDFGLTVPAEPNVCRFHVVTEGSCHVVARGASACLSRGDLVLVPHGLEHQLLARPTVAPEGLDRALESGAYDGTGDFVWGEGETTCRLVCGHFEFDKRTSHPLLEALPPLIHVRATPTYEFGWIDQVMRFIGEETVSDRPGSDVIARRLSEILFVQVIRHFAEESAEPVPVLAAITDGRISRALSAMHSGLGEPWNLASLARVAGMSRTAFAERFSELVGLPPMRYLGDQRMREAARLLRTGRTAGAVALEVGYQSQAAFTRKFTRAFGEGPGSYRRREAR